MAAGSNPTVGVGVAAGPQASSVSSAERNSARPVSLEIMEGTLQALGIIAYIQAGISRTLALCVWRLLQTKNPRSSLRRGLTIRPIFERGDSATDTMAV